MINSLHKKIALVLLFITQMAVPMEQLPLACGLLGSDTVSLGLGVFSCNVLAMLNYDKSFTRGAIGAGLGFVALLMTSLNGKEIVNCGYDNNVAAARNVIFLGIVASLINQTSFIYKKSIDQLKRENNPENKLVWEFCKQVDYGDLLRYAVGVGLLSVLFGVPTL